METVEHAPTQSSTIQDDELVGELDALSVHFLSGGDGRSRRQLSEAELLAGLCDATGTRLQVAGGRPVRTSAQIRHWQLH